MKCIAALTCGLIFMTASHVQGQDLAEHDAALERPLEVPAVPLAPDPPSRALRIVAEAGFGALGGVGLLAATAVLLSGDGGGGWGVALIAASAIPTGLALGVYGGGALVGGNGGLGWTVLGELTGILLSLGVAIGLAESGHEIPAAVVGILPPIIGAILGYELSHDDDEYEYGSNVEPGLTVSATIAPLPQGAVVQILGAF